MVAAANQRIKRFPANDYEQAANMRALDDDLGNVGAHAIALVVFGATVLDEETITVDNYVYEFDTTAPPGAIVSGGTRVDVSGGATAAAAAIAFAAAFNATPPAAGRARQLRAVVLAGVNTVALVASGPATAPLDPDTRFNGIVISETMSDAANKVENVRSGSYHSTRSAVVARPVTAQEVAAAMMIIPLPFLPTSWNVRFVTTSTGVAYAWDGVVSVVAAAGDLPAYAKLTIGSTAFAATHTVQAQFFG